MENLDIQKICLQLYNLADFIEYVSTDLNDSVKSLYLFGSASNGDFVKNYSDLDLFVLLSSVDTHSILKTLLLLRKKTESHAIMNIDFTIMHVDEIYNKDNVTINPLLYQQIIIGDRLYGTELPVIFTEQEIKNDSVYVMSTALRKIRGSANKINRMKPYMAFRFCDEMLFTFLKSFIYYMSSDFVTSRVKIYKRMQSMLTNFDLKCVEEFIEFRENKYGESTGLNVNPLDLFVKINYLVEDLWKIITSENESKKQDTGYDQTLNSRNFELVDCTTL